MARIARVIVPGIPHHITQRGNRRQQTFFCDEDYRSYISFIANLEKVLNRTLSRQMPGPKRKNRNTINKYGVPRI